MGDLWKVLYFVACWVTTASVTAKSLNGETYYTQGSQSAQTLQQYQQNPNTKQYQQNPNTNQYQQNPSTNQYQQNSNTAQYQQQEHDAYQSPYSEYDENIESYEYPSSEEMPVKNAQYVPVESSDDEGNSTGGYIPQRQMSLQEFLQQHMLQQQNDQKVTDEGNLEIVSIPDSPGGGQNDTIFHFYPGQSEGPSVAQHYENQQQQQYVQPHIYQNQDESLYQFSSTSTTTSSPHPPSAIAAPKKKSNVHKLVVEARRTGDGKIAVVRVRDKFKVARQKRSMMTLSREDENDSEYDDLDSSVQLTRNVTTTSSPKSKS